MEALLDLADNWMHVIRVELTVFADNERAIAVYEKQGFAQEGVRRMQYRTGGTFRDEVLMAWFPPDRAEEEPS